MSEIWLVTGTDTGVGKTVVTAAIAAAATAHGRRVGVLKPAQPLPLKEREKVRVTVLREGGLAEQTYGLIGWKGDAATFDRILAEAEEGAEGRP